MSGISTVGAIAPERPSAPLAQQPTIAPIGPEPAEAKPARTGGHRLPYRPGLDGLRALAVAGVFLYHAGVAWVPGGFLGVDVFFVLSGYLITSLLLGERGADGRIDLRAFWTRRARRLFPAVVVVILFALLATSTIARDDLARTRADALSSLVYVTNWREIIASHSYFNAFGRPSLLQHLWSLAVEEQFYLFWPLILIAALRWLRTGRTVLLTLLLAAGSFALMWFLYNPEGDPSAVYYGTETRAFTLMIGALLAFAWPAAKLRADIKVPAARLLDAVGVIALLAVLAFFWRVHDYDPWTYRGGFLVLALCAAGLVAVLAHPATLLGGLMGSAPLRWLGVRSYGIYLWHWPILELTRPNVDVPLHGLPLIAAQAAATVAVAALSYRYIENPIRRGTAQRRLRAWLDAHTPHQRLGWAAGALVGVLVVAALGFAPPSPRNAQAAQPTATPAALAVPKPLTTSSPDLGTPHTAAPDPTRPPGPLQTAPAAGASHSKTRAHGGSGPGALPPGAILAVGDSVMLGCAEDLEHRLGPRLHVDAVVGRQVGKTIARLVEYRAHGALPETVVVQVGDNGPVWYADMQHLRRVLAGVPRVILVNVRLARSWQNQVDGELSEYIQTWPQATLANWYAHSDPQMLSDGVHPAVPARRVYTRVILEALRASERRTS